MLKWQHRAHIHLLMWFLAFCILSRPPVDSSHEWAQWLEEVKLQDFTIKTLQLIQHLTQRKTTCYSDLSDYSKVVRSGAKLQQIKSASFVVLYKPLSAVYLINLETHRSVVFNWNLLDRISSPHLNQRSLVVSVSVPKDSLAATSCLCVDPDGEALAWGEGGGRQRGRVGTSEPLEVISKLRHQICSDSVPRPLRLRMGK